MYSFSSLKRIRQYKMMLEGVISNDKSRKWVVIIIEEWN